VHFVATIDVGIASATKRTVWVHNVATIGVGVRV
jgi:hypothetical protein